MPTASIACVRPTATDRPARRKALRWFIGAALTVAAVQGAALAAPPNPDPVFPFSREVEAFAKADAGHPIASDATLFIGSSSIRLWDTAASFTGMTTVNRGFGGASTPHVLHYYDRLRPPGRLRAIVVYVGENDLAGGATPDKVSKDLLTLLKRLRTDYARAAIACLSLKPSPLRWMLWPKMMAVNQAVMAAAGKMRITYLDVGSSLLAPDGLPDASLFRQDGLHMNPRGYERWTRIVRGWLEQRPVGRRTALSD